jgi:hypothetical protein
MGKKIRIQIRDERPGSYIRELVSNFFGFFDADPGSGMEHIRILDGKKFGSWINIPDQQH